MQFQIQGHHLLRAAAAATAALTRVQFSLSSFTEKELRIAPFFFPAIGLAVGLTGAILFRGVEAAASSQIAIIVALAGMTIVTGARVERSLARLADAWASPPELRDEIMVSHGHGAAGIAAIVLMFLLRYGLLNYQTEATRCFLALLIGGVVWGWMFVALRQIRASEPSEDASDNALGDAIQWRPSADKFMLFTAICILAIFPLGRYTLIAACLLAPAVLFTYDQFVARVNGGCTPDNARVMGLAGELIIYIAAMLT